MTAISDMTSETMPRPLTIRLEHDIDIGGIFSERKYSMRYSLDAPISDISTSLVGRPRSQQSKGPTSDSLATAHHTGVVDEALMSTYSL